MTDTRNRKFHPNDPFRDDDQSECNTSSAGMTPLEPTANQISRKCHYTNKIGSDPLETNEDDEIKTM